MARIRHNLTNESKRHALKAYCLAPHWTRMSAVRRAADRLFHCWVGMYERPIANGTEWVARSKAKPLKAWDFIALCSLLTQFPFIGSPRRTSAAVTASIGVWPSTTNIERRFPIFFLWKWLPPIRAFSWTWFPYWPGSRRITVKADAGWSISRWTVNE